MYLKVVVDNSGNTDIVIPLPEFTMNCPYCRTVHTYISGYHTDFFCDFCGKMLVTKIKNISNVKNLSEEYSDEEITEFMRICREGGSLCERNDAVVSLGKVNKKHNKIGVIFALLYKMNKTDPDNQIREYAREAMENLKYRSSLS